ncbi:2-oxoglutarate (2OG) and Fe(II)-dependent oxygenase superfamily protein, putative [Theobroma cacao]|uniref:2-oxoglutarate (2OG) and Fe(II)-dependent oxygenase superfamily protein, putative n=1 Tax=Theobroma cacao TaxID=3641 RepID=A0A061ELR8_THECC|nr:2-oxoglutarate (2OG) and Fe(II)-dependent oxygenase superfamily protein, putative [Theobroma cacao]
MEMESNYDRRRELRAFDDSKTDVKGLVDSGVAKIPPIFFDERYQRDFRSDSGNCKVSIPIIDFEGIDKDTVKHSKVVDRIRDACLKRGFFQVINYGIPISILEEMLDGIRRFHKQETESKKEFYTRDATRKVAYNTN